jgi:hypothetical protein
MSLACFARENPPLHTAIGANDLGFYQFLEYLGKKTAGDFILFGDLVDKADLFERLACQIQDTSYPIITFSSNLH